RPAGLGIRGPGQDAVLGSGPSVPEACRAGGGPQDDGAAAVRLAEGQSERSAAGADLEPGRDGRPGARYSRRGFAAPSRTPASNGPFGRLDKMFRNRAASLASRLAMQALERKRLAMIISRTPFRVSFFGGGTDYPAWYRRHGGAVLATSINKYCYITCRYLPPFFEHKYCIVYSKIENRHTIDEIARPAVREVLRFVGEERGVEVHHDGDLPARSGMGSSSAFTVGLLHAMHALQGRIVHKKQLATESIHLEQNVLKETVGSQDQVLAAYGGLNQVVFQPGG